MANLGEPKKVHEIEPLQEPVPLAPEDLPLEEPTFDPDREEVPEHVGRRVW